MELDGLSGMNGCARLESVSALWLCLRLSVGVRIAVVPVEGEEEDAAMLDRFESEGRALRLDTVVLPIVRPQEVTFLLLLLLFEGPFSAIVLLEDLEIPSFRFIVLLEGRMAVLDLILDNLDVSV